MGLARPVENRSCAPRKRRQITGNRAQLDFREVSQVRPKRTIQIVGESQILTECELRLLLSRASKIENSPGKLPPERMRPRHSACDDGEFETFDRRHPGLCHHV